MKKARKLLFLIVLAAGVVGTGALGLFIARALDRDEGGTKRLAGGVSPRFPMRQNEKRGVVQQLPQVVGDAGSKPVLAESSQSTQEDAATESGADDSSEEDDCSDGSRLAAPGHGGRKLTEEEKEKRDREDEKLRKRRRVDPDLVKVSKEQALKIAYDALVSRGEMGLTLAWDEFYDLFKNVARLRKDESYPLIGRDTWQLSAQGVEAIVDARIGFVVTLFNEQAVLRIPELQDVPRDDDAERQRVYSPYLQIPMERAREIAWSFVCERYPELSGRKLRAAEGLSIALTMVNYYFSWTQEADSPDEIVFPNEAYVEVNPVTGKIVWYKAKSFVYSPVGSPAVPTEDRAIEVVTKRLAEEFDGKNGRKITLWPRAAGLLFLQRQEEYGGDRVTPWWNSGFSYEFFDGREVRRNGKGLAWVNADTGESFIALDEENK